MGGSGVPIGGFLGSGVVGRKALRAGFWKGYCGVVDEEMVVLLGEEGGRDFGAGRRGAVGVDVKQWGVGFDSWGCVSCFGCRNPRSVGVLERCLSANFP